MEQYQQAKAHSMNVRFYRRPWQNFYLSTVEGREIYEDRDFVEILIPGNSQTIIDTLAEDYHIKSYPVEWARYQNAINGEERTVGTPLSSWALVSPAVAENLKYHKFYTVEQVAGASDMQLQAVEHMVGMSAFAFRDQAKYFLLSSKEQANKVAQVAQVEELKNQNEDLRLAMIKMNEQIMALSAAKPAPSKRARKPKVVKGDDLLEDAVALGD